MKITHLKLKDFGPHKNLDIDLDSNIVGIIGPNGSGKSNLLQAINYALTGDLNKTNQSKYIRNFGTEDGPKKAVVELTFEKGGKTGTIVREITGTTSKRCLTWEGDEYRKQDDVDRVLAGIMSADKAVLTNAVFVKQGSISELVQGTPSERQEIFQKMMHLSFIGKLDQKLLSKISALQAGIIDYDPQIAILSARRTELIKESEVIQDSIDELAVAKNATTAVESYVDAADKLSTYTVQYREAARAYEEALSAVRGDSQEELDRLSEEEADTQAMLDHCKPAAGIAENWREAEAALHDAKENLAGAQGALADIKAPSLAVDVDFAKESIKKAEAAMQFIDEKAVLEEKLTAAKAAETKAWLALKDAEKRRKDAEDTRAANRPAFEISLKSLYLEGKGIELKLEVLRTGRAETAVCPMCGGPFHMDPVEDTEEKLSQKLKVTQDLEQKVRQGMQQLDEDVKKASDECALLRWGAEKETERQENVAEELEAYTTWPFDDLPQDKECIISVKTLYEKALADHEEFTAKVEAASAQVTGAAQVVAALESNLSKVVARAKDLGYSSVGELDAAAAKEFGLAGALHAVTAKKAALEVRLNAVTAAKSKKDKLSQTISDAQADLNSREGDDVLTEYLAHYKEETGTEFDRTNSIQRTELRNMLAGALGCLEALVDRKRDAVAALDRADGELASLLEMKRKNEKRVKLIHDLQQVRDVVGKNGAPRDYCDHVFNQITDVVQELLVQMGANFTVEPDESRAMTYNFVRTDNDEGYSMGQERLSGGQAIRLALSLLIACQQMVLPEVGLLVLDEPSSHVDAEGVINMRDMLLSLHQILESADMQLILVDHNEVLNAAFGKTVQLSALSDR